MKAGKAPGSCAVYPEYILHGGNKALKTLHSIFTRVWEVEVVPEEWHQGVIIPLYKRKGSRSDCSNYRGITLLSVTKRDVHKINALDQWCLRKLLGIKWYHNVRNDEVRQTTGQPRLSAIVQAWRLSLFGHIARMPDETDTRSIVTASPSENWRRPPGRPRTTWMKTIQQDLRPNNLFPG